MIVSPGVFGAYLKDAVQGTTGPANLAASVGDYAQGVQRNGMDPTTQMVYDSALLQTSQSVGAKGMDMPAENRHD